ncbi:MAG: M28 family metallopeptidase [Planctomyces sp.]
MAKMYADLPPDANVRSIMFVGFTAEESGLNGARYMIRNMPVEAKNVYAMLNMDMIGRYRPNIGVQVEGVGTAEGFEDLLDPHPRPAHRCWADTARSCPCSASRTRSSPRRACCGSCTSRR